MFKRILVNSIIILTAYLVLPSQIFSQPYSYEGTQVCGMCHHTEKSGNQLKVWQDSKHAQAFKALQTAEADKVAAAKGFKTKAAETKECLKCHVSGYGIDKALVGAKFKMEDGVQCETCHGAGSGYKMIMKNKDESIKKGLMVHADPAKFCTTCHNSDSPFFKGFKYDEMWKKIAHPTPKG